MKMRDSYHPYAMVTIVCWAIAFVFTRMCVNYFTTFSMAFLRYFAASITLAIILLFKKIRKPEKQDIIWFVIAGAAGFFLYTILFNAGTSYVTAATSSIIIATVPIMTSVMALVFYKEQLKAHQWMAVAVEFTGIIVLTLVGDSFSTNQGVFLLVIAAVCLSTYNIVQKKLTRKYTSFEVSAYSIFIGSLMLAIFLPGSLTEAKSAEPIAFFYIAVLGVFSSAIAYLCWATAFSKAEKAANVSNYMFITPLLTAVLGFILAKEVPGKETIIGGLIIISGVLLFNKDNIFSKNK